MGVKHDSNAWDHSTRSNWLPGGIFGRVKQIIFGAHEKKMTGLQSGKELVDPNWLVLMRSVDLL